MHMDSQKVERRKHLRMDSFLDGAFSAEGMAGLTMVHNVSREGLRVSLNRPVSVGTRLTLDLWLPGSDAPVTGTWQVMWAAHSPESWAYGHGAGLSLVSMDRYERARVMDYAYDEWRRKHASEASARERPAAAPAAEAV